MENSKKDWFEFKKIQQKKKIKVGQLLVADPFLYDPNFFKTVILLTEVSGDGVVGFVLNRNLKNSDSGLLVHNTLKNLPINSGGPVGQDSLFILHNNRELKNDSEKINDGVYWLKNLESLLELMKFVNDLSPYKFKLILGYSGWTIYQLHNEIESGSWFQFDLDFDIFTMGSDEDVWSNILINKGLPYKLIAQYPKYPWWN
jgi:putative transcriptional regulator